MARSFGGGSGALAFESFLERVRTAPVTIPELARRVAAESERIIRRNIAAGRAPDGTAWPATADGHAPLREAMKSITVVATLREIVFTVAGVEARHHLGIVKGGRARRLIPVGQIPGSILEACERVFAAVMAEHFGVAS